MTGTERRGTAQRRTPAAPGKIDTRIALNASIILPVPRLPPRTAGEVPA